MSKEPIEFLKQALLIAAAIQKEPVSQWLLLGEFRPSYGEFSTCALVAIVFIMRKQLTNAPLSVFTGPVFWQIVIGWILGLKADRFWADWGIPAVLVWLTLQLEEILAEVWSAVSWKRWLVSGMVGVSLFLTSTNDLDRRYTASQNEVFLDATEPALQGWMPETNGIFYCAQMAFFYNTYYKNPKAHWRYILGMEPALLPDEDRRICRTIQLNPYAFTSYEPWIQKMQTRDRLAILGGPQPNLPQLEWTQAVGRIWIGRLPKNNPR